MEPAGAPLQASTGRSEGRPAQSAKGQMGPTKASGVRILPSEGFSKVFSKHRKSCRPALRIDSLVSFLLSPAQERVARDSRALREGAPPPKDRIPGKELGTENPLGRGQFKNRVSAKALALALRHLCSIYLLRLRGISQR